MGPNRPLRAEDPPLSGPEALAVGRLARRTFAQRLSEHPATRVLLPDAATEAKGSQLFVRRGIAVFSFATTPVASPFADVASGGDDDGDDDTDDDDVLRLPRLLCLRRVEIATSRWDPRKARPRLRARAADPFAAAVASARRLARHGAGPSEASRAADEHASQLEFAAPPGDGAGDGASAFGWMDLDADWEFDPARRLVTVQLRRDVACTAFQLIVEVDEYNVGLHMLRVVAGNPATALRLPTYPTASGEALVPSAHPVAVAFPAAREASRLTTSSPRPLSVVVSTCGASCDAAGVPGGAFETYGDGTKIRLGSVTAAAASSSIFAAGGVGGKGGGGGSSEDDAPAEEYYWAKADEAGRVYAVALPSEHPCSGHEAGQPPQEPQEWWAWVKLWRPNNRSSFRSHGFWLDDVATTSSGSGGHSNGGGGGVRAAASPTRLTSPSSPPIPASKGSAGYEVFDVAQRKTNCITRPLRAYGSTVEDGASGVWVRSGRALVVPPQQPPQPPPPPPLTLGLAGMGREGETQAADGARRYRFKWGSAKDGNAYSFGASAFLFTTSPTNDPAEAAALARQASAASKAGRVAGIAAVAGLPASGACAPSGSVFISFNTTADPAGFGRGSRGSLAVGPLLLAAPGKPFRALVRSTRPANGGAAADGGASGVMRANTGTFAVAFRVDASWGCGLGLGVVSGALSVRFSHASREVTVNGTALPHTEGGRPGGGGGAGSGDDIAGGGSWTEQHGRVAPGCIVQLELDTRAPALAWSIDGITVGRLGPTKLDHALAASEPAASEPEAVAALAAALRGHDGLQFFVGSDGVGTLRGALVVPLAGPPRLQGRALRRGAAVPATSEARGSVSGGGGSDSSGDDVENSHTPASFSTKSPPLTPAVVPALAVSSIGCPFDAGAVTSVALRVSAAELRAWVGSDPAALSPSHPPAPSVEHPVEHPVVCIFERVRRPDRGGVHLRLIARRPLAFGADPTAAVLTHPSEVPGGGVTCGGGGAAAAAAAAKSAPGGVPGGASSDGRSALLVSALSPALIVCRGALLGVFRSRQDPLHAGESPTLVLDGARDRWFFCGYDAAAAALRAPTTDAATPNPTAAPSAVPRGPLLSLHRAPAGAPLWWSATVVEDAGAAAGPEHEALSPSPLRPSRVLRLGGSLFTVPSAPTHVAEPDVTVTGAAPASVAASGAEDGSEVVQGAAAAAGIAPALARALAAWVTAKAGGAGREAGCCGDGSSGNVDGDGVDAAAVVWALAGLAASPAAAQLLVPRDAPFDGAGGGAGCSKGTGVDDGAPESADALMDWLAPVVTRCLGWSTPAPTTSATTDSQPPQAQPFTQPEAHVATGALLLCVGVLVAAEARGGTSGLTSVAAALVARLPGIARAIVATVLGGDGGDDGGDGSGGSGGGVQSTSSGSSATAAGCLAGLRLLALLVDAQAFAVGAIAVGAAAAPSEGCSLRTLLSIDVFGLDTEVTDGPSAALLMFASGLAHPANRCSEPAAATGVAFLGAAARLHSRLCTIAASEGSAAAGPAASGGRLLLLPASVAASRLCRRLASACAPGTLAAAAAALGALRGRQAAALAPDDEVSEHPAAVIAAAASKAAAVLVAAECSASHTAAAAPSSLESPESLGDSEVVPGSPSGNTDDAKKGATRMNKGQPPKGS